MQFSRLFKQLTWRWPWYLLAALASVAVGNTAPSPQRFYELGAFTLLAVLVMVKERLPEALILPAVLASWLLIQAHWEFWQTMLAASGLCLLIFASQFIWRVVTPLQLGWPASAPARVLALSGQMGVTVALLLVYGGSGPTASPLALQAGAVALLILGLLLLCFAYTQPSRRVRIWSFYGIGLLLALTCSWELRVLPGLTIDVLLLPPASYLLVIAPFLLRDKTLPGSRRIGQLVSLVGACGLFLPSFILSNVAQGSVGSLPARLVSTLLLLAESLGLFMLGIVTRVRYLLLGGTGLVVVGAIEAMIYATSHSQQAGVMLVWLALAVSGGALIGGAAFLTLRRATA
jgi:hypothetical protein